MTRLLILLILSILFSFMYRKFSLLLFLLAFAVSGVAQKPAPADALEANLRKHVQYLASDALAGRRTGERGSTVAAGYVANQFAQFKLKPGIRTANAKPGYLQAFPYVAGVSVGEGSYLRLVPADTSRENKIEEGVSYTPFGNSINGDVANAPLVFAGYGIATPDKKYDDYAGLDARGKIVLAFDGTPDADNPHSEFGLFNIHSKANIAKERGAKALVLIARSDDFQADPHSRLKYEPTTGETAVPVVIVARSIAAEILGVSGVKELAEMEKWLAMKTNAPPAQAETRPVGSVPSDLKASARLKVNLVKKTVEAYNVIGILEGSDPTLKNEAIVIGAHYDHLGHGGQGSLSPNSSDIHHGADDNASGTAAIIELARQFAVRNPRGSKGAPSNKRTLIFMAFGGEEEGLLGSKYYVNNPVWPLDKTVAMINLDMVGRLHDNKLTIGGIGTASEWKRMVEEQNALSLAQPAPNSIAGPGTSSRHSTFALALNEDGFGPSDHASFYAKEIPVLFFFTGTHLDYHKPSDTFEKINYDGLTNIANYVAAIARSIDENPVRPTYQKAKSSGMATRTAFNVSLGTIPSYAETNDGLGLDGVRDDSPADKAGLKAGDKIIKLAGKEVRNISDYMFALSTMKANEEYEVVVKRGTETVTLKIVPAAAARR
ncbi:MAG: M28 family peptidase [Pyrinomonadaceae bacterium]